MTLRFSSAVQYRAFVAPSLPRLDVYASVPSLDGDVTAALDEARPTTLISARPDGTVTLVEHPGGREGDLSVLTRLPLATADDLVVSLAGIQRSTFVFDMRHAALLFGSGDPSTRAVRGVRVEHADVVLLFDSSDRLAGVLFTDVVHDDTTDAVDAWCEAHDFPTD